MSTLQVAKLSFAVSSANSTGHTLPLPMIPGLINEIRSINWNVGQNGSVGYGLIGLGHRHDRSGSPLVADTLQGVWWMDQWQVGSAQDIGKIGGQTLFPDPYDVAGPQRYFFNVISAASSNLAIFVYFTVRRVGKLEWANTARRTVRAF